MTTGGRRRVVAAFVGASAICLAARAADTGLADCHVAGIANGVLCGSIERPLDPEHPGHATITVKYVVVPAMARRKIADPVFM